MNTIPKVSDQLKKKLAELRRQSIARMKEGAAMRPQIARAKQERYEQQEADRQKIAPAPIEFDSRWSWACSLFNKKCRGNLSFLKVWSRAGKTWDARDLGSWFEDVKALLDSDIETLDEYPGNDN